MLASVMSSCSAYMITSSALFTENLYRPMVPGRSSAHYIGASRVASVLIVAGGLGFAYWLPSLVKGLEIWLSIAPMMGIAFWMGLFWRRTTVAGAWASAIAGFVVWALAVQAPVVDRVGGLPYADALRLVWHESGRAPEIYEPWRIIAYLSAGIAAGVGVSLVTRRVDPEKLDRFYALVRTPARPGERVETPCTLPPGTVVPRRRMLLTSFELEVPMPSRTSLLGFAAGWVMVGLLLGGFAWYVRG